ncbi:MAG: MarR family transcriptional regulator [Pirellulales bacterium]|nr:MarR family transcriptional regulator [Pirellulales bacterium]
MNSAHSDSGDARLLELLRRHGSMTVSQVAQATAVTPTAVRQRLARLMSRGLVERHVQRPQPASPDATGGAEGSAVRGGRGRPSHRYVLTELARRQAGSNFADLAMVLWREIRSVKEPEVRRGLLQRIAEGLASLYRGEIHGVTLSARMQALRELFARRRVPLEVEPAGGAPVLKVVDCPYPELAEADRGICAVERMLFAELLESPLRLSQCRLEGHDCCQFEVN